MSNTTRTVPADFRALERAIDSDFRKLASGAERKARKAEAEARNAAMTEAARAMGVTRTELVEALEVEKDARLVERARQAERASSRADDMQVFTRHSNAQEAGKQGARNMAYVAASVMLEALPRTSNVVLATRAQDDTIRAFTLESVPTVSVALARKLRAERKARRALEAWEALGAEAAREAKLSRWKKASNTTLGKLGRAERKARKLESKAREAGSDYQKSLYSANGLHAAPVASFHVPARVTRASVEAEAEALAAKVPARADIHPFPSKLGRGKATGSTQATRPGTRLVLATRDSRVADPFDSVAEAKREARRARDARRTGHTAANRALAREVAMHDASNALALMERERKLADRAQIDRERRAERARQRRAAMTPEDRATRNMALRNKRRAAKNH